jgi:hypothetical protein
VPSVVYTVNYGAVLRVQCEPNRESVRRESNVLHRESYRNCLVTLFFVKDEKDVILNFVLNE